MSKYVIGLDFGTLSGRCLLVDAENGAEIAEAVVDYPHGVMDQCLPNGKKLPPRYALQHPADYLEVLRLAIPQVLREGRVAREEIVGVGLDFTACTLIPIDGEGTPLCLKKEYSENEHAYVKLWKHHGAQPYADRINELAAARREPWLRDYGGRISCEWALPKILEILQEAPKVFSDTCRFTEAADWLSLLLTGEETHSAAFAGYKWLWNRKTGYPSNDFMKALDPRLDGIVGDRISERVVGVEQRAGRLNERGAALTGLCVGTPLAIPMIDGHAAMPALNVTEKGEMMLILGTSSCQMINDSEERWVEGICGFVEGGVIPDTYTYEAGQAGVGDLFHWFVKHGVPASYETEARERGLGIHALLREKAQRLRVGESGLLALDWWNGNRSVLVNSRLTGMILGMTLGTKPEEIYRALIEATAYGLKVILDRFEESGLTIQSICAAGGIAQKDDMMMQIYADVLNREIRVAGTAQAAARGSAIYASAAAGIYPSLRAAARAMSQPYRGVFRPKEGNVAVYRTLYEEYKRLHDYFGRENEVMERLGSLRS